MNLSKKSNSNAVIIGKILKPRGLLGEVKVQILTNKHEAFSFVEKVERVKFGGGFAFIKFKDVNSIADAEKLRGHEIKIPRELLPLGANEIIADDLVGFNVLGQDGRKLGTVRSVETVGKSEVIDCGKFSFPYENAFVIETNMKTKQIIVRDEMLAEESVL
jgi:16S rRNA processing protein RimM